MKLSQTHELCLATKSKNNLIRPQIKLHIWEKKNQNSKKNAYSQSLV